MSSFSEPIERELDGLLPLVANGDRRAFGRLYDITSGKLFAVVRCVLKKPELAEEALQEAFIKVWQRAALLRGRLAAAHSLACGHCPQSGH